MVMYTCMISVPPVISYSVRKSMQKLRLVASLVEEVSFNMFLRGYDRATGSDMKRNRVLNH